MAIAQTAETKIIKEWNKIKNIQDDAITRFNALLKQYNTKKHWTFKSDTGSGKSYMMWKLCETNPDIYFQISTLSKGKLNEQLIKQFQKYNEMYKPINNYFIYGRAALNSKTTNMTNESLKASMLKEAKNRKIYYIKDESHIEDNIKDNSYCEKIINFSATPDNDADIQPLFTQTLLLKRPKFHEDKFDYDKENDKAYTFDIALAIDTLKNIKKTMAPTKINPCMIIKVSDKWQYEKYAKVLDKHKLKYFNLNGENSHMLEQLCDDDNEIDVIFTQEVLKEGIDIRRAFIVAWAYDCDTVSYKTFKQLVGRTTRNPLFLNKTYFDFSKEIQDCSKVSYIFAPDKIAEEYSCVSATEFEVGYKIPILNQILITKNNNKKLVAYDTEWGKLKHYRYFGSDWVLKEVVLKNYYDDINKPQYNYFEYHFEINRNIVDSDTYIQNRIKGCDLKEINRLGIYKISDLTKYTNEELCTYINNFSLYDKIYKIMRRWEIENFNEINNIVINPITVWKKRNYNGTLEKLEVKYFYCKNFLKNHHDSSPSEFFLNNWGNTQKNYSAKKEEFQQNYAIFEKNVLEQMFEYHVALSNKNISRLSVQIKSFLNAKYAILNKDEILADKQPKTLKYGKDSFINNSTKILLKVNNNILNADSIPEYLAQKILVKYGEMNIRLMLWYAFDNARAVSFSSAKRPWTYVHIKYYIELIKKYTANAQGLIDKILLKNKAKWSDYSIVENYYGKVDFYFKGSMISVKTKAELNDNDILQMLVYREIFKIEKLYIVNAQNNTFFEIDYKLHEYINK